MLTHKGTKEIATNRLILRRFKEDDAQEMFDTWANDSEVTKYLTWRPHGTVDVTKQILKDWCEEYKNNNYYHWGITINSKLIGAISIVRQSERDDYVEIGYCIGKSYWGQGIMTEAASAVIDFCFSELSCNKVEISHATKNPASGRVAQKCGLTFDGIRRQHFRKHDGELLDIAYYSILKSEWEK